jgi:isoleucyl-tRNA synthetase
MYARLDGIDVTRQISATARPETDRWMISLLEETVRSVTGALDDYDALRAGTAIEAFVDRLSNWYVRTNRRRFWKSESGEDKLSAYATLYECVETVNRLIAPFMPFLSEAIYQNLVRTQLSEAPVSVHMAPWPQYHAERVDYELLAELEIVQRVVALGRAARNDSNLRVRQPLARLLVRTPVAAAARAVHRHEEQIRQELNVKRIEILPQDAALVTYRIKPNLRVVGKRYGALVPAIRQELTQLDGAAIAARVMHGETIALRVAGQAVELEPGALLVETTAAKGFACAEAGGYLVALDTTLTAELLREGLARELVRTVQEARKQAGLNVADRIVLDIEGNDAVAAALSAHRDFVGGETLTSRWGRLGGPAAFHSPEHQVGEASWVIHLERDGSEEIGQR